MKSIFSIIFILISSFSFADGGGRYTSKCIIHEMDATNNLFYNSVDGYVFFTNKKEKKDSFNVTTNIAIYDIESQKTKYLFPDTMNEKVVRFYFESHFDEIAQKMIFNLEDNDYRLDRIVGNNNLKDKIPSNQLIIVTYSHVSEKYTLWTADKLGEDLLKLHEFLEIDDYYIDVQNRVVRFVNQKGNEIITTDIKYDEMVGRSFKK